MEDSNNQRRSEILSGPPAGYFVIVPADSEEQAINLAKIAPIIKRSWKVWVATSFLGGVAAAGISLLLPNVYRAQTLVAPVQQGNSAGGSGGIGSQIGGLAALAGVDLTGNGSRKQESLATLTSAQLARDFIASENLMPVLFPQNWDAANNRWREDKTAPTLEAGVRKLTKEVIFIVENHNTSLVMVAAEWYSPGLAAKWANRMVEMANEHIREVARRNAELSIGFLNKELEKSNDLELRQSIYRLIEQQVNSAMLANVQLEYAYRTIDPAVPPDRKFAPKRAVMSVFGAVIGLFCGLVAVLVRHRYARARPAS